MITPHYRDGRSDVSLLGQVTLAGLVYQHPAPNTSTGEQLLDFAGAEITTSIHDMAVFGNHPSENACVERC